MAKLKQTIKKSIRHKNNSAKYVINYKTTYKLRPLGNSSYRYTVTTASNLTYKGN